MGAIKTVGIVIFNGIERLDFEGPLGVLGWAARLSNEPVSVLRISKDGQPVRDQLHGRKIKADASLVDPGSFDLLVVPGGDTGQFADDEELIAGEQVVASNYIFQSTVPEKCPTCRKHGRVDIDFEVERDAIEGLEISTRVTCVGSKGARTPVPLKDCGLPTLSVRIPLDASPKA